MKNITTHKGILNVTRRLPSSRNGNPRYEFEIDGYTAVTTPDSQHGYGLTNHDGKECVVTLGTHYGVLSLNNIEKSAYSKLRPLNGHYIQHVMTKHLINGVYDFKGSDDLKLAHICHRFNQEYNYAENKKRYPMLLNRIKEWLAGLPLQISFSNCDIIEHVETWHGVILNDSQADKAIETWFNDLAFTLMGAARKSNMVKMTCDGFEILTDEKVTF